MRRPALKPNMLDRVIRVVDPVRYMRRMRARMGAELLTSYAGADRKGRALREWTPFGKDPDEDLLCELTDLRDRSRDLVRNNPLACGAIKTKVTHVVGTGLRLQSRVDREFLGLTDDQADALESTIQREWCLFFDSKDCDLSRTCTGSELTRIVYQQEKENGDSLVLLPKRVRPGVPYSLTLQVVESDRLCNENHKIDEDDLAGGVKKDADGAPVEYQILNQHPGNMKKSKTEVWEKVPAFGPRTGLRNVIHLYRPTRPGQTRGVPDLTPVIEIIKQLGRYTEAEVMAAVVSGYFTVFIESEDGGIDLDYDTVDGRSTRGNDKAEYRLGSGMIVELNAGEKIHDSNPGRPNANFDPFIIAGLRQVGMALEIPFEILVKHFTKSYSAARASLLEFWRFVKSERKWLVDNFLRIVFEVWMWEAVADGRIPAPGFFADPAVRKAYLGSVWTGTSKGQIDEKKEVEAAVARIDGGLSTLADETMELTGGDWEANHRQQVKEKKKRVKDGLVDDGLNSPDDDGGVDQDNPDAVDHEDEGAEE